jgi:rhodanese-related sulfurtransferase
MMELPAITVQELAQKIAEGNAALQNANLQAANLQLVDVREPNELAIAQIPGFINLPLSQAEIWSQNIQEYLDPTKETLVLCHHGMRSAQMTGWLIQQGFERVKNISGGIDAYSVRVDNAVPRY